MMVNAAYGVSTPHRVTGQAPPLCGSGEAESFVPSLEPLRLE